MVADVVIRAENLGKKYVIGHQAAERHSTFRDAIVGAARGWRRSVRNMARGAANVAGDELEEFWALKDIDFEIRRGDVVGIIGRNGAGKSTLLKVLSRITEPTQGKVEIKGRVASLLEVGTGFHPELSGRENVYLNGAILGMSRAEIKGKFDEIVAFAEIEKFLDTPVKRYSSGMYVRLAFAVAAHLEPEILIVDEVLAVGDAEFQKKCLGKMQDVAGHGRTVLFVSHQLTAVRSLCPSSILLGAGRLQDIGPTATLLQKYLQNSELPMTRWTASVPNKFDNDYFVPHEVTLSGDLVSVSGLLKKYDDRLVLGFSLETDDGTLLLWTTHRDRTNVLASDFAGREIELGFQLPRSLLNTGRYSLKFSAFLHNREYLIAADHGPQITFEVNEPLERSEGFLQPRAGHLAPELAWVTKLAQRTSKYAVNV